MRRLVTPQAILGVLMAFPASAVAKKPPVPPRSELREWPPSLGATRTRRVKR
jgi:hypothetical protein